MRQAITEEDWVGVVRGEFHQPDCSGIGAVHVLFRAHLEAPEFAVYARMPLGAASLPDAPFYLVGARRHFARTIDLHRVCIPLATEVAAEAHWAMPLADEAEALAWAERLRHRACGWTAPACRRCASECGDGSDACCEVWTDSCPGPAEAYSTCAGFFPCDPQCCG